jgi:hypothetical protein
MADAFYLPPDPAVLNQGDIIDHVPWGLIEAPTTLCRPNNRQSVNGKAFYGSVEDLKNPPPWSLEPEFVHGVSWEGLAIVLWHGCQLDKWKNQGADQNRLAKAFAGVAPILPLDKIQPPEYRQEVVARKHSSFFPLPAFTVGERQIPESYVDLRHIWSVRQSALVAKMAGLSDAARLSLYEHLFTFFTRFRLDADPVCPTCGTAVPLQMAAEEEAGEGEGEAAVAPPG